MTTADEKTRARKAVKYAKRIGSLVVQPCEVCGSVENIQAHHDDYAHPLAVRWLCFRHHRELHGHYVFGEEPSEVVRFRLSPDMLCSIKELAAANNRTVTAEVRIALRAHVAQASKKNGRAA